MSIANELSSEVAAAVLAHDKEKGQEQTEELTRVVLAVHSTLRRLTGDERRRRAQTIAARQAGDYLAARLTGSKQNS